MALRRNFKLSDLVLRLATVEDYKGVLDINHDIYKKTDYLPGSYMQFHHDPDHLQFVAEYNHTIVSYRSCLFVESHAAFMGMAERTHPDYQKLGINEAMTKHTWDYLKELCLKMGHNELTARRIKVQTEKAKNPLSRFLCQWNFFRYKDIQGEFVQNQMKQAEYLGDDQMFVENLTVINRLIQDPKQVKNLKKFGEYIIVDACWVAMLVNEQNLLKVAKKYKTLFSLDKFGLSQGISTLSCCTTIDGSIRVDLFYNGEPDIDVWMLHFNRHITNAFTIIPVSTNVHAYVHFPMALSENNIKGVLNKSFGKHVEKPAKVAVLFEEYAKLDAKL